MDDRIVHVSLTEIRPNPWQVRAGLDEVRIAELAADIAARGLLQVPLGRVVDAGGVQLVQIARRIQEGWLDLTDLLEEGGCFVQLAFGHCRLEAFRLLSAEDPACRSIPVRIQDLSDEEMACAAWAENAQRKDLSPIEEAQAISKRMEDFAWTQEAVAERLGLARSTVANKLRLLDLPEEVRDQVAGGAVPERSATALCALYDLPEEVQASARGTYELQRVLKNLPARTSEEVRTAIRDAITWACKELGKTFPPDEALEGEGVRQPLCEGCSHRVRRNRSRPRCADPACYKAKELAWKRFSLARASEATGIPFLDPARDEGDGYAFFYNWREFYQTALEQALAGKCSHLRLAAPRYHSQSYLGPEGFEGVCYACVREGGCECKDHQEAEEKKEEDRQKEEVERERDQAAEQVAEALLAGEPAALRAVLYAISHWQGREKIFEIDDPKRLAHDIAVRAICEASNYHLDRDLERYRVFLREWLQERGFEVAACADAESVGAPTMDPDLLPLDVDQIGWLTSVPADDVNFKSHLKQASVPLLRLALERLQERPKTKTAVRAIEAELRRRARVAGTADVGAPTLG